MRRTSDSGQPRAWGYLLPLSGDLPPLELRDAETAVGTAAATGRALRVDAASLGLAASAAPRDLFRVLSAGRADAAPVLRSECGLLRVDESALGCDRDAPLKHGSRVVLGLANATYVFVDHTISENFRAPQQVLSAYLVGPRLGEGSFGQVFLLFDKASRSERRAMKIVEVSDEDQRVYAEREAEILLSVKHPCVIETYSVKQLERQQFLVMEFMGGGDLSHYVNSRRPLNEAQTKLLFFQLALAVRYLHEKNVCHRDLKPANILLQCRNPRTLIKVTDFGLAKNDELHSSLRSIAGTDAYLAPEIMNGDHASYTLSVDVWSMGVILFYSLTGSLPFPGTKEALRHLYRVAYTHEKWREVSVQARGLVQRMLRVAPSDRASLEEVVENAWTQDDAMREEAYRLTGLENIRGPRRPAPSREADIAGLLRHLPPLDKRGGGAAGPR